MTILKEKQYVARVCIECLLEDKVGPPVNVLTHRDAGLKFYEILVSWRKRLNDVDEVHYGINYWLHVLNKLYGFELLTFDNGDFTYPHEERHADIGLFMTLQARVTALIEIRNAIKQETSVYVNFKDGSGWPIIEGWITGVIEMVDLDAPTIRFVPKNGGGEIKIEFSRILWVRRTGR